MPFLFKTFWKKVIVKEILNGMYEVMAKNIGTASPGSRAWPQKSLDTKIGIRVDYGELFTDSNGIRRRNFVVQPNKNAENEILRKLANENSHQQLCTVSLPVDEKHREGVTNESLIDTFHDSMF